MLKLLRQEGRSAQWWPECSQQVETSRLRQDGPTACYAHDYLKKNHGEMSIIQIIMDGVHYFGAPIMHNCGCSEGNSLQQMANQQLRLFSWDPIWATSDLLSSALSMP